MYRLHVGLRKFGIDCKILSAIKTLESTESEEIPRSPRLESWIGEVTSNLGLNNIHCVGSFKVRKNGFYLDADIINFHVLHSGFFSYPQLLTEKTWCLLCMICGALLVTVPTAMTVIAGKLAAANLPRHLSSCAEIIPA